MPTPPDDAPPTVTQIQPPRDGTTPAFELPSETVAATPEQQKLSAELSNKPNADLIADRYLLGEEIGRGGMGVVYYAKDVRLNREVAVKLLLERFPVDSVIAARFVEEARITAQLQHPGIAPVHDLGTLANGRPFLAMKLIKGKTLSAHLKKNPTPSPSPKAGGEQETLPFPSGKDTISGSPFLSGKGAGGVRWLDVFSEICQTVAFAHSKNVIHRDLKPANVMVGAFGEVQVMDWGLAKLMRNAEFGMRNEDEKTDEKNEHRSLIESDRTPDSETLAGSVMGTPAYMPPEQAKGEVERTNARSDVFALGAILCELLTGDPPYTGSFEEVRAHSILGDIQPARARLAASGADPDLIALATDCLDPDPANRPADASEVVTRLTAYRTGVADRLRKSEQDRAAAEVRVHEQIKRRRVWLALAALMVIGTATSVVFAVKASFAEQFAKGEKLKADIATDEAITAHADTQKQKDRADKQLTRAEWLVYANSIDDAQRHWREGRADLAAEELNSCRLDYRGWEHDYFTTLMYDSSVTFHGHTNVVRNITFSQDGRRIVSGSDDKSVRLWDVGTGQQLAEFKGHSNDVMCVAFNLDGQRIFSLSSDETVREWDACNGKSVAEIKGHTVEIKSVAFSPDGSRIASGSINGTVRVRDVYSGQSVVELKGHTNLVTCIAFSPDGQRIVSGCGNNTVRVWNVGSGQLILEFKVHTGIVHSMAFSPDGQRIVSGGNGTVCVWDAWSGQSIANIKGHTHIVQSVAFSPDGRTIVSGCGYGMIRVWDWWSGQSIVDLKGHTGGISSVAFSPNGRCIASGSEDNTVRVWHILNGQAVAKIENNPKPLKRKRLAFSPDGRRIVSGDDIESTRLYEGGGQYVAEFGTRGSISGRITRAAISPDGRRIVSGSKDGTMCIWDANSGQPVKEIRGHAESVTSLAFSPDGWRIVSGCDGGIVLLWEVGNSQPIAKFIGHIGSVTSVAFSLDGGRVASGSEGGMVRLWEVGCELPFAELKGHSSLVTRLAFSPDGRRIFSGSFDNSIRVWDAKIGQSVLEFKGYAGNINSEGFTWDGQRLVFRNSEGVVTELLGSQSQPVYKLQSTTLAISIALSADNSRIYAAIENQKKLAWLTATGQPAPDDEPIPDFEGKTEVFTPDGKFSARIVNGKVQLRDEAKWARFDAEMKRRLREWSQPNPAWHLKRADECAKDKNDFAERFHLRWVVKQVPTDFGSAVRLAAVEARMSNLK